MFVLLYKKCILQFQNCLVMFQKQYGLLYSLVQNVLKESNLVFVYLWKHQ